jgi:hypothetical protein
MIFSCLFLNYVYRCREKSNTYTEVFNTKKYYIKIEKKIQFYVSSKQKEQINLKKTNKWLNVEVAMID